jgi:hypothetical protein
MSGKLVARRLTTAALWVRIQTSLKKQMGDIIQNTLARQISIEKKEKKLFKYFYLYIWKHYKKQIHRVCFDF